MILPLDVISGIGLIITVLVSLLVITRTSKGCKDKRQYQNAINELIEEVCRIRSAIYDIYYSFDDLVQRKTSVRYPVPLLTNWNDIILDEVLVWIPRDVRKDMDKLQSYVHIYEFQVNHYYATDNKRPSKRLALKALDRVEDALKQIRQPRKQQSEGRSQY